jgi:hypothetical protein
MGNFFPKFENCFKTEFLKAKARPLSRKEPEPTTKKIQKHQPILKSPSNPFGTKRKVLGKLDRLSHRDFLLEA